MNTFKTLKISTVAVALSILLVGCDSGGGGGDAGAPVPPTMPPVTPKPPVELSPNLVSLPNSDPNNQTNVAYQNALTSVPANPPIATSFIAANAGMGLFRNKNKKSGEELRIPTQFVTKKHQFRSTWIPTVGGILYKYENASTSTNFKKVFDAYMKVHNDLKLNAVIFQVRPELDAFYKSNINPWSRFLNSGTQGLNSWTDKDAFDPLTYMVEETHKSGMEYHAWLNPYRVTYSDHSKSYSSTATIPQKLDALNKAGILSAQNFAVKNPTLVYEYNNRFYLNPSKPDVVKHVVDSIVEIITNYDVDAIQFDDYFYIGDTIDSTNYTTQFDYNEFKQTTGKSSQADFEQWRRDNVTNLITEVKKAITTHNQTNSKAVQFGVSPGGVWCNLNPATTSLCKTGSVTTAAETFEGTTFADTKLWAEKGYVDYLAPQIYWSFELNAAPYGEVAYWWNGIFKNAPQPSDGTLTQFYVGHGNYKALEGAAADPSWINKDQIPAQLRYNLTLDNVDGSIFYQLNHIDPANTNKIIQDTVATLKSSYLNTHTLPPAKPWLDKNGKVPDKPMDAHFVVTDLAQTKFDTIQWKDSPANDTRYYVVYRGLGDPSLICDNPANIIKKVWRGSGNTFLSAFSSSSTTQYTYLVSAVDAAQQESECAEVLISETMVK